MTQDDLVSESSRRNFLKALVLLLASFVATFIVIACGSAVGQVQAQRRIDPAVAKLGKGFVSNTAKVNGTTLHYVRGGTGPAVILIHGWPQDWYEFRKVMPRLAKKFTVISVDLRGVGGSSATPGGYDAANMAEDVYQLSQQLKLDHVYVAGHDIGGAVAYAFVRLHPTAARGVMILEAPLAGIEPWEELKHDPTFWHSGFHQTPDLPEKLIAGRQSIYFKHFFTSYTFNKNAITEADAAHYANAYASPAQLRAGMEFYRAFPANEKWNAAQRSALDVPLVLVGGDKSFAKLLPKMADDLRAHGCKTVTIETIKDCGHYLADDQPESVAELIERFASSQG
jgi:pimeloyl-ACP methyl ester carboxylesterase